MESKFSLSVPLGKKEKKPHTSHPVALISSLICGELHSIAGV